MGQSFADERLARTLAIWSQRSRSPLTDEDARQIAENMIAFFRVLLTWKSATVQQIQPARDDLPGLSLLPPRAKEFESILGRSADVAEVGTMLGS